MTDSDFTPRSEIPVFLRNLPGEKNKKTRVLSVVLGLFLLVGGVAAGAALITQQQLFEQKASTGVTYCTPENAVNGYCTPPPGGGRGCLDTGCNAGQLCHCQGGVTCTYGVCVPDDYFHTACEGDGRVVCGNPVNPQGVTCCEDGYVCGGGGNGCVPGTNRTPPGTSTSRPSPTPTLRPTPTPTATPTPSATPTPTPIPTATPVAMCQRIEIYSPAWTRISTDTFRTLSAGARVYFCVGGFTNSSTPFDKARFTINGVRRSETTTRRPGTGDYCDLYTIPQSTYNFRVSGELHHPVLGWH